MGTVVVVEEEVRGRVGALLLLRTQDGRIGMFLIGMQPRRNIGRVGRVMRLVASMLDRREWNDGGCCTLLMSVMLELYYGWTAIIYPCLLFFSRRGKAVRLSYDHKGTDEAEGRRIAAAGGLILNSRVNGRTPLKFVCLTILGVLAVTRALGDTYMKDYISGHPFTTETILSNNSDEFMILACDGVFPSPNSFFSFNFVHVSYLVVGRLPRSNRRQPDT